MKGQSTLVAFLLALLLIILILIPTYYLILDYSKPTVKQANFVEIAKNQINGGSISIFYNATVNKYGNVTILVLHGNGNFTLSAVYIMYNGTILNITNYVEAYISQPGVPKLIGTLPKPLVYNFTILANIGKVSVWNNILILQINAYNQTIFASLYPNETALS